MPEPDPLPSIKTPWGSATPPSGAGASAGNVSPIPVPDHTLIRRIGKGSYGEVWLARNVLGVYRAVKIIDRHAFDDDRPFEREFAGMQRFEPFSRTHESQLNILHVGRGPESFYYVMELADDMSHGAAIDEGSYTPRNLRSELLLHGRLPVDECVRLGLALTTALGHLHRHGLVHRDIKPSNIVFVNGIPKLADIGLVARAEATMSFVGTEGYLPPEGPGTVQADVFSLGKVLYEISTGRDRQQFPELPTGITELPDRAALAELNEVLLRACAPDVKQRYESAAEMHADLALLQSGKSVARLRAVERRLKFVARAAAVVAGLAVLAGAAFFYQQVQTREARRLANENKALAETKTQLADDKSKLAEANREQLVRLRVANGIRLLDDGDPSAALLWFTEALPLVTNRPAEEAIHRIRIQQVLDRTPRLLNVVAEDATIGDESVTASAFSPDGTLAATAAYSGRLQVWNVQSGKVLWGPRRLNAPIRFLRFTGDGRRLLVGSVTTSTTGIASLMAVLDAQTGQELLPALQQIDGVAFRSVCSAFSPDDQWLAVALSNHVIRVLDARDGRLVVELPGHTKLVEGFRFSADGAILASASADKTVRLWRLPSGEPQGVPLAFDGGILQIALSDDGRRLLTVARTRTEKTVESTESLIQMWDAQTGTRIGKEWTETNLMAARVLTFCPGRNDRFIFAHFPRCEADVRDSSTMKSIFPPMKMAAIPRCWSFSPDGKNIAIGNDDSSAYVWSLETGELLHPRFRSAGWVESVHFSPDGSRLLTTSDDGTAKVWSLRQDAEAARLALSANHKTDGTPQTHRRRERTPGPIPVRLEDEALHLIDPEGLTELDVLITPETKTNGWDYTAGLSGRCWAVSERLGGETPRSIVTLWLREGRGWRREVLPHPTNVVHSAFNADDSRLFTFSRDSNVRVWRTSDGGLERSIAVPPSLTFVSAAIFQEVFRPDGGALPVIHGEIGRDRYLQLFDLATGKLTGKPFALSKFSGRTARMRFSPDGRRLASVGTDQSGTIIDFQTGELAAPKFKHGGDLTDLDWSPDGKRLITAGLSPEIKLWDTATGEMLLSPMFFLSTSVMVARWSADGRFIVGRSEDRFVRVWDATTTEAVTPMLRHSGYIEWMCITLGNRLITASGTNLLRSWNLKPTALAPDILADYAKVLSSRRLNASGALIPIKSSELATLFQSLRARAPQLFATP